LRARGARFPFRGNQGDSEEQLVISDLPDGNEAHASLAGLVVKSEMIPGGQIRSDADIEEVVEKTAWGHHACGTGKIGPDRGRGAVVDGDLSVHGTQGLRVVDASVFPEIPGFFIVSSVHLVSEKASDVILRDAR
jgi:choline dehydrogenase